MRSLRSKDEEFIAQEAKSSATPSRGCLTADGWCVKYPSTHSGRLRSGTSHISCLKCSFWKKNVSFVHQLNLIISLVEIRHWLSCLKVATANTQQLPNTRKLTATVQRIGFFKHHKMSSPPPPIKRSPWILTHISANTEICFSFTFTSNKSSSPHHEHFS